MVQSFACKQTHDLFITRKSRRWRGCDTVAVRKLDQLEAALSLNDLRVPPGNRLESLSGDRAVRHSIRVNDQWRIVFAWKSDGPHNVEIVDYH